MPSAANANANGRPAWTSNPSSAPATKYASRFTKAIEQRDPGQGRQSTTIATGRSDGELPEGTAAEDQGSTSSKVWTSTILRPAAARFTPISDIPLKDWRFTIRHGLEFIFVVTQAAWPALVNSGRGVIINTTSVAAHRGFGHLPGLAHVAAMGGVLAKTRQLAAEAPPTGSA